MRTFLVIVFIHTLYCSFGQETQKQNANALAFGNPVAVNGIINTYAGSGGGNLDFIAAIAGGTAAPGTFIDGGGPGSMCCDLPVYINLLNKEGETGTAPKAYLNYLLFDRDFNFLGGGYERLSVAAKENGTGVQHERLAFNNIEIKEAGYAYIYLSNENDTPVEVYFDDFRVEHTESAVVQINGFYPYGMPAYTWVREGQEETRAKFQGKEYEDKTGWHDFHARQYDATLGRWFVGDPANQFASPYLGMGNNPVIGVDPDGRFWNIVIGAAIGGVVNLGIQAASGNVDDFGDGLKAFGSGAVTGALAGMGCSSCALWQSGVSAATSVGSNYIPSHEFDIGGGLTFRISPSIGYGSTGLSMMANLQLQYSSENFSAGVNYGFGYSFTDNIINKGGWNQTLGGGYFIGGPNFQVGLTSSQFWGRGINQRTGGAVVQGKDWGVTYENDWFFGADTGDNGDRFRTAAISVTVKDVTAGLNMFTGDPGLSSVERKAGVEEGPGLGPRGVYGNGADDYRAGLLYLRIGNYRFGTNSENVRAFVQNEVIHRYISKVPYFRKMNNDWNPYFQYQTVNPFTLW